MKKKKKSRAQILPFFFLNLECNAFNRAFSVLTFIKTGIECVEVFAVEFFLGDAQCFTETLKMHDFAFPQESDWCTYIRIFDKAEDIVVGGAGFLFWGDCVRTTY